MSTSDPYTDAKKLIENRSKLFRWLREKLLLILFSILIVLQFMTWLELTKLPHYAPDTCGTRYDDGCWLRDEDLNLLAAKIGEEIEKRMPANR
jgi:hypothetical protein